MSLLKKVTTRMKRMNKNVTELDASKNSSEYKIKANWDSVVYIRELAIHLSELYYLVF